jgi:hypothetical protein
MLEHVQSRHEDAPGADAMLEVLVVYSNFGVPWAAREMLQSLRTSQLAEENS